MSSNVYQSADSKPGFTEAEDARRSAPAALRNREPIREVLVRVLPTTGTVLEIAAGTGEHAVAFAAALPGVTWLPSDPEPGMRASIAAHAAAEGVANVAEPLDLDVSADTWPVERADALVCINLLHISPWAATQGLFAGCARILPPGAPVVVYGPFTRDGAHTSESNAKFDAQLRSKNPEWGIRDVAEVAGDAQRHGVALDEVVEMPANNLILVMRMTSDRRA
ncbi:Protein of unknown function [Limimonas halophila]|uniref:SAM-dependent methyltransferase n=1 Tax=Limimonas halophila TaxID=1082479 RepID=A0A1G7RJI8_9PROT|nr:DUF938 domain-containing protein [Limimonas halophila]SDG10901.1 Protein of unknown function [Limimonas halophila]